jgi:hypothetical protein
MMSLQKRVKSAYLFPTGILAVCDIKGEQIPELQGTYSIEKHMRILLERFDDCEFQGFGILPPGFCQTAFAKADYFRGRNLSYEEIQKI